MKYYDTKHALTEGIVEFDGAPCKSNPNYIVGADRGHSAFPKFLKFGKDAFSNYDLAVMRANEMRIKRIKALEKQLKKLQTPFITK